MPKKIKYRLTDLTTTKRLKVRLDLTATELSVTLPGGQQLSIVLDDEQFLVRLRLTKDEQPSELVSLTAAPQDRYVVGPDGTVFGPCTACQASELADRLEGLICDYAGKPL